MKQFRAVLAIFAAVLLFSACSSSPQSMIVGTWQLEGPMKVAYEFHKDGTVKLLAMGRSVDGTYKLVGDSVLEMPTGEGGIEKIKVKLSADELELTHGNDTTNPPAKFRRK